MTPRRVVSLLLFVSVATSSLEVVFADGPGLGADAQATDGPAGVVTADLESERGSSGDDCTCLCACACSGAQLVVGPPRVALVFADAPLHEVVPEVELAPERIYPRLRVRPQLA